LPDRDAGDDRDHLAVGQHMGFATVGQAAVTRVVTVGALPYNSR
jgi:hypothetical protein